MKVSKFVYGELRWLVRANGRVTAAFINSNAAVEFARERAKVVTSIRYEVSDNESEEIFAQFFQAPNSDV